jgi:integrase
MPRPNKGFRIGDKPVGGVWYIVWTEGGRSKRKSTFTGSRAEADRELARFVLSYERALAEYEGPIVPTVAEVLQAYRAGHVADNELDHPREVWLACARNVESSKLGARLATEVTPEDVKLYGRERAAGKIGYIDDAGKRRGYRQGGPAAFRNDMMCLNSALRWCVANRKFSGLTLATLHPVQIPSPPEPRTHYFTIAEADTLLQAAKAREPKGFDPLYLFILICLDTASRKEPVESLTWDRVTLRQGPDGQWQGEIDFQEPGRRKTKKRRGVNDLSPATAAVLADARKAAKTPYVLGTPGTREFAFRRLAKRVTGKEVGPHILRHSWATWAISNAVPPVEVAAVLHDTVATVMRVYGHLLPEKRRSAVNLVAGLRAAANDPLPAGENEGATPARKGGVTLA